MDAARREALLKEYSETNANFRLLTDIRFKLLALLPVSSVAVLALKGDGFGPTGLVFSLFGLVVTLALASYNARNDQLYDEMVGRAASIERSLGIPDGGFANRPRAWLSFSIRPIRWEVGHRDAVAVVYGATCALWLTGVLAPVFEFGRTVYLSGPLPRFTTDHPDRLVTVVAGLVAAALVFRVHAALRAQRDARASRLRTAARDAVRRATGKSMRQLLNDRTMLSLCEELGGVSALEVTRRAAFYASLDPEAMDHYLLRDTVESCAAQAVGLLTDLPARWLLDCATNRRGRL